MGQPDILRDIIDVIGRHGAMTFVELVVTQVCKPAPLTFALRMLDARGFLEKRQRIVKGAVLTLPVTEYRLTRKGRSAFRTGVL